MALIRREDALAAIDAVGAHSSSTLVVKAKCYAAVKTDSVVPTVDAEMVVRCRDCKYAHMTCSGECKYCDFWQEEGGDSLYLDGDFYCAAGERRDEG